MNYSTQGYRTNSPDKNNPYNVIPSNIISMKGVSQPITAIPIINGKPDYSKRQVLQPEQDDFIFEGAEAVLELPYAQIGTTVGILQNGFLPNFNFGTSDIPQTTVPSSGTNLNFLSGVIPGSSLPQGLNTPWNEQRNLEIQQNNIDYNRQVDNYKNQYSQPDAVQTSLYSSEEEINKLMGIEDPLQSQTDFNNAVKSIQDSNTTPETEEKVGNWWDMFNNIGQTRDLSSSLTRAGYGLGWKADNYEWASEQQRGMAKTGNTLATVGAIGNTLLKGGKDFFSGMALANREQQAVNEYHEDASRRMRDRNTYFAEKGGEIPTQKKDEMVITGSYTTGIPEGSPIIPNAEVEKNEFILHNDGSVQQVVGKPHEQDGELMSLEPGTKIVSDHLKIGGELSKRLTKEFDLDTRANNTYAKVIDKYRSKTGLTKLLDEYQQVIGKIKDQEETEHSTTKEINLNFLSRRIQELEAKKLPLEEELSRFTDFIFQEQEYKKEQTNTSEKYQEGGEVNETEQILNTYSQLTGIPFEQLLQEFNSLTAQEKQQFIQEVLQELEQMSAQSQNQSQGQGAEQVLQAYSQATGTDINQLAQQLEQMTPEQQQQALAQMEQELQQSQQQYRKGGNVPKYQEGALTPQQQRDLYFSMMNPLQEMFDRGLGIAGSPDLLSNAPTAVPTTIQAPVGTGVIDPPNNQQAGVVTAPNNIYGFGLPNFSFNPPTNLQTSVTNTQNEGSAFNAPGRNNFYLNPSNFGEFAYLNPIAVGEFEAQHFNPQTGVYDNVDEDFTLNWYQKYNPTLVEGLVHTVEDGLALKTTKDAGELQKRYQQQVKDNVALFAEEYGYNVEELNKYADAIKFNPDAKFGDSSRRFDSKYGQFTSTRSIFQKPVVTPEQLKQLNEEGLYTAQQVLKNTDKAKEILGDRYEEVVRGLDKYKNADYVIGALQDQPTTTEETTTTTNTTNSTTNPYTQDSKQQINLPWSEIDQRIPFPMAMDLGRKQSVSPIATNPVNTSVEPILNEINRQTTFANQLASYAPDSSRAALYANNLTNQTQTSNQAITANNLQNAQLNLQTGQYNENQIGAAGNMNIELAENYTDRFLRTKAVLESQQAGWYDLMARLAAKKHQNQFNRNLAQSMYPNMRLNSDGNIYGMGETIELPSLLNKTQSAEKGGTIKDYLKSIMFKNR